MERAGFVRASRAGGRRWYTGHQADETLVCPRGLRKLLQGLRRNVIVHVLHCQFVVLLAPTLLVLSRSPR